MCHLLDEPSYKLPPPSASSSSPPSSSSSLAIGALGARLLTRSLFSSSLSPEHKAQLHPARQADVRSSCFLKSSVWLEVLSYFRPRSAVLIASSISSFSFRTFSFSILTTIVCRAATIDAGPLRGVDPNKFVSV